MGTNVIDLHWLDWVVVAIYGGVIFGIAFWAMRQIKDAGGLLVGKRNMGKWMMAAASFAGGTNANHPMSTAAAAYKSGMPGIWLSLTWMLITPFFLALSAAHSPPAHCHLGRYCADALRSVYGKPL